MSRVIPAERAERRRHDQKCLICGTHTGEPSKNKPPRKFCSGKCMGAARRKQTCFLGHPLGDDRTSRCAECSKARNRKKRLGIVKACQFCGIATNARAKVCWPCKTTVYARHRMLRRYRLSAEDLDALVIRSEGRCESCSEPTSDLNIDHSHVTGRVRGLLCSICNTAAGIIEDVRGRCAARYLEKFGDGLPIQPRPRARAAEVIRAEITAIPTPAFKFIKAVKERCGLEKNTAIRAARSLGVIETRVGRSVFWSSPSSSRASEPPGPKPNDIGDKASGPG